MNLVAPIDLKDIRIEPLKPGSGIWINSIPVDLEHVAKNDSRVDLSDGEKRAFVVEHILAPLKMMGIRDVNVLGRESSWDFARPVHRFAYSVGMKANSVFGPSDGRHHFEIVDAVYNLSCIQNAEDIEYKTVSQRIFLDYPPYGTIEIDPAPRGSGLNMELISGGNRISVTVYVTGRANSIDILDKVLTSRTPAVRGLYSEEPLWHAVGDFTADLGGVGGITDAKITANLGMNYHAITIGALKKAFKKGGC